ncbi:MAG: hypothetical protein KJ017_08860 [Alphaproteobacteria bacterium]|nr:hypothetical protein [Alphaproteobacteria bacterium]
MTDGRLTPRELIAREEQRAAEREDARRADPSIGLNLEGQRRSTNVVEYRPSLWNQVVDFFEGPQKDVSQRGFWSYDPVLDSPNGFTEEQVFNTRKLLGFLTEETLQDQAPEIRNLHSLRENDEAFEGYLYDLDSRGIRLVVDSGENQPLSFGLRITPFNAYGDPVATEQLAETERLLRQREPEIYDRSETPLFGPSAPPAPR